MDYDYQKIVIALRNKLVVSQEELAKILGVSLQVLIGGKEVVMNLLLKLKERFLNCVKRMMLN